MKNTENSWKTRILSSFLFAVFTQTVPDGENRLDMTEGIKLDWFFVIKSSQALPVIIKNTKTDFLVINYVIMTSHDDFLQKPTSPLNSP